LSGVTYIVRVAGATPATGSFQLTVTRLFVLQFNSALGPGSIGFSLTGGPAGVPYLVAISFNPGSFPNGPFFGIELTFNEALAQIAAGYPFYGALNSCGAFTFPTIVAPFLTGQAIFSVGVASTPTGLVSTAPVSHVIP
jgi:hypothetical protein